MYLFIDMDQLPGIIYGVDEVNPTIEENLPIEKSTNENGKTYNHVRYDPRDIKIPIQVDIKLIERELHRLGRRFESTCYELALDDNSRHFVFPRQLQINPCKFYTILYILYIYICIYIFASSHLYTFILYLYLFISIYIYFYSIRQASCCKFH